jgi:hypothetical protein
MTHADGSQRSITWKVQASHTGELDINDILDINSKNREMYKFQPRHNWIGTTIEAGDKCRPVGLPPPFGMRSPQAAREFNLQLHEERFGRENLDLRNKKDAHRAKVIAQMKKKRANPPPKAWSPMEAYQRHLEPQKTKKLDVGAAPRDEVTEAFRGTQTKAPVQSMGVKYRVKNYCDETPGAIYNLKRSEQHTRPTAPAATLHHHFPQGGIMHTIGALGAPRSPTTAIGLGPTNYSEGMASLVPGTHTGEPQESSQPYRRNAGQRFDCQRKDTRQRHPCSPGPKYEATQAFMQTVGSAPAHSFPTTNHGDGAEAVGAATLGPGPALDCPSSFGPGPNSPNFNLTQSHSSSHTFGEVHHHLDFKGSDFPGPGKYKVNRNHDSTNRVAPKYTFGAGLQSGKKGTEGKATAAR